MSRFPKSRIQSRGSLRRAFTLVEMLMVVAVLSTVSAMAILTTISVRESSEDVKLSRDVAVLNKALRQYEVSGGSLGSLTDPQRVLDKMKTKLTGDNKKQMAGMRGGMVDQRLKVELLPDAEAGGQAARARYRQDLLQFEITRSGTGGIKRFVLDDSLAAVDYGTEARTTTLKLAKEDQWVWDFKDTTPSRDKPGVPQTANPTVTQPVPPAVTMLTLAGPKFNLDSGTYPLNKFPVSVIITDPNAAGLAEVQYNASGGPFQRVTTALTLDPGTVVSAFASPTDPDNYQESPAVVRDYRTTPETPLLKLVFSSLNLSYADLGGAMLPAGTPGAPMEGQLSMTNRSAVPDIYENSNNFLPQWTLDGTDPLNSASAVRSAAFTGGYPGNAIPVVLAAWKPADSTLTVKAAIKTLKPALITNSAIEQAVLKRNVLPLPPPVISFLDRDCTLTLDSSGNNVPVGARIFYTLDGTDPGDKSGEPVSGTLYAGPFILDGSYGQVIQITARTYPPVDWKPWFTTSIKVDKTYKLPAAVDVYVGGDFYSGSGSPLRNIARLSGSGAVDTRFDTGSGASPGSLVGVIRQAGGGVLAGGDFEQVNGAARPGLVLLKANGSVDTSFDAGLAGGK